MTTHSLALKHCTPMKSNQQPLDAAKAKEQLQWLPDWSLIEDGTAITKDFRFKDFHRTLGFINAVGFIANQQDHHPDIEAGYGHCQLRWSTHDVNGLSINDFICAAKVEALLEH